MKRMKQRKPEPTYIFQITSIKTHAFFLISGPGAHDQAWLFPVDGRQGIKSGF